MDDSNSKHSDFDFESGELAETLIPSYCRAIAFPLYRSWALADACRNDVAHFLLRGTRTVLRCLLELRAILDAHEVYYVYSRIWLDDFCRWIQACARYMVFTTSALLLLNLHDFYLKNIPFTFLGRTLWYDLATSLAT